MTIHTVDALVARLTADQIDVVVQHCDELYEMSGGTSGPGYGELEEDEYEHTCGDDSGAIANAVGWLFGFAEALDADAHVLVALAASRTKPPVYLDARGNWHRATYALDNEEMDIADFLAVNHEDRAIDSERIFALKVGEEISYGGGASPVMVLRRTS